MEPPIQDERSRRMQFYGYLLPPFDPPCFAVPLFGREPDFFVQDVSENDIVTSLMPCDVGGNVIVKSSSDAFETMAGNNAQFAFAFSSDHIIRGSKEDLRRKLKEHVQEFSARPFLAIDLQEFFNDDTLLADLYERSALLLGESNRDIAVKWLQMEAPPNVYEKIVEKANQGDEELRKLFALPQMKREVLPKPSLPMISWIGKIRALVNRRWLVEVMRLTTPRFIAVGVTVLVLAALVIWVINLRPRKPVPEIVHHPTPTIALSPTPLGLPAPPTSPPPVAPPLLTDGGGQIRVESTGDVQLAKLSLSEENTQLIREALQGKLPSPENSERLREVSVRSNPSNNLSATPIYPVGRVVATTEPVLQWKPRSQATRFRVHVYTGDLVEVWSGEFTNQKTARVPSGKLKAGSDYLWEVKVWDEQQASWVAPPDSIPKVRFAIPSPDLLQQINKAQRRQPKISLLLVGLYAQAGLFEEAETELHALKKANPNSSLPDRLLKEIKKTRHSISGDRR